MGLKVRFLPTFKWDKNYAASVESYVEKISPEGFFEAADYPLAKTLHRA